MAQSVNPTPTIAIGVHVHAEPERLRGTLAALEAFTPGSFDLLLLADGPDEETAAALVGLGHIRQSTTAAPVGGAACLNRLWRETKADVVVFLESGAVVGPGWIERLLEALQVDPRHGLASPSTNRAWNQLAAFPGGTGDPAAIAAFAAEAQQRFGAGWKLLAPLWDIGDFCMAIRREVFQAIGPADESYDQGPCWEMDYAVRAARAGWLSVWARGAYVWRAPLTERRRREEEARFDASRRRYQDNFCGLRRSGERSAYASHCRGEDCPHFAPLPAPRAPPLVTCIMPTNGRPDWVGQSIRYFQRQDYPNLELVIIDASPDHRLAPLPDDPRIRRERIGAHATIGAMRNRACQLARGEIVIHWDDDDWYAPQRISTQVEPILGGRADITGLNDTRFFELDGGRFWRCTPRLHGRLFVQDVHGGTLAFRRSLWNDHCQYPDVSLAEDAGFLRQAVGSGARLARLPSAALFLYLRHGRNAWTFPCGSYLDPRGWIADAEPEWLAPDRAFYATRSPAMTKTAPPLPAEIADAAGGIAIGVHVHAEPDRLRETLTALAAHTPAGVSLLLLPDGPDAETSRALERLSAIAQSATATAMGPAACFNRLASQTPADTLILLESGTIVSPRWLERLLAALTAQPRNGLASPSTNRAWNQLAAFPNRRGGAAEIARAAEDAERCFKGSWKSLSPLWDVGDFCLAVRRAVVDAIGPADEGYGPGPCWEMDYAARAAHAGFLPIWAQGAFVWRHPATARRQAQETARFEANRRRYQDRFCGLRRSGARTTYARHCHGEACSQFGRASPRASTVLSPEPFVSCIMPTANRRRFVSDAIQQFLAQDYPARELIILDDGEDSVEDLAPAHPDIRYVRQPRRGTIGAKRNAACELARGDIILHWDDDDWYAPRRIRAQVEALSHSGAEVCGIDKVLFYDPRGPMAWEYVYPAGAAPWVCGATLCYRRDFWRAHPFPDIMIGEDNLFAGAARPGEICVMPDNRFFVALVHGANTSPKHTRDPRWRRYDVATVRALVGETWPRG